MMSAVRPMLARLERDRPEWGPWILVIANVLHEAEGAAWSGAVPDVAPDSGTAPRLAGASVAVPGNILRALFERLLDDASRSGTGEMASLANLRGDALDALDVFAAALHQDADRLARLAGASGADADALQAVAALLPVPFLHACRGAWASSIGEGWMAPYCPICGSWPAFAEARGIERSRYYRCGRCGCDWRTHGLTCPFCATTDHHDLVTLVPENPAAAASVEACTRCLGYVKTFNRLQGCAPLAVMLEDLGGVALDVAALAQGYSRPAGAGYALHATVTDAAARRGMLAGL